MDIFFSLILLTIAIILSMFFLLAIYLIFKIYTGKSINNPNYAPVHGSIFGQLLYFNRFHDHLTQVATKHPTFRLLTPDQSQLYTVDPRNVEHILKKKFDKYSKGKNNQGLLSDFLGHGIFAVDGDKWRQQRKLASFEFSTRVLRDFSCSVFRQNAGKLARAVSELAVPGRVFDMQDMAC